MSFFRKRKIRKPNKTTDTKQPQRKHGTVFAQLAALIQFSAYLDCSNPSQPQILISSEARSG
jgi:hypothetical protein